MKALKFVFMEMAAFGVIFGMILLVTGLLYHTDGDDKTTDAPTEFEYGRVISKGVTGEPRSTEVYIMEDGTNVYVYKDENRNAITGGRGH